MYQTEIRNKIHLPYYKQWQLQQKHIVFETIVDQQVAPLRVTPKSNNAFVNSATDC